VFKTPDALEAHALAAELNEEGIDAHVVGDYLSGGLGLTVGTTNLAELWVPESDEARARELLAKWRPTMSASTPKLQFSLKTALVAMTLVAIAASISLIHQLPGVLLGLFQFALAGAAVLVVVRRWSQGRRM
jgi:hypothetical protein